MIVERLCTVDQLLFRLARHTHNRHGREKHQQKDKQKKTVRLELNRNIP